jgi:hypothetical protein
MGDRRAYNLVGMAHRGRDTLFPLTDRTLFPSVHEDWLQATQTDEVHHLEDHSVSHGE